MKEAKPLTPEEKKTHGAPALLTIDEACQKLRISRWSFYRLIQRRKLQTIRIGRRRLVPEVAIDELIDTLRQEEVD